MKIDCQNNTYDDLLSFEARAKAWPILEEAAEKGVFRLISQNAAYEDILQCLSEDKAEAEILLDILSECGLILRGKDWICNTPLADRYLTNGAPDTEKETKFGERNFKLLCGEAKIRRISNLKDTILPADDEILAFWGHFKNDYTLPTALRRLEAYRSNRDFPLFETEEIQSFCKKHQLRYTAPVSVTNETSVIFAGKSAEILNTLTVTPVQRTVAALKKLDFKSVTEISPADVVIPTWVKDHCRFGCSSFGSKHCPPFSPNYEQTLTRLSDYHTALLIEGVPPTHSFQRLMLRAEHIAFKTGFYRAFAYWAGPCSICKECTPPPQPKVCTATRPSMESAGIDVFATVRKQGFQLNTLKDKDEYVKYFGLLLLD